MTLVAEAGGDESLCLGLPEFPVGFVSLYVAVERVACNASMRARRVLELGRPKAAVLRRAGGVGRRNCAGCRPGAVAAVKEETR